MWEKFTMQIMHHGATETHWPGRTSFSSFVHNGTSHLHSWIASSPFTNQKLLNIVQSKNKIIWERKIHNSWHSSELWPSVRLHLDLARFSYMMNSAILYIFFYNHFPCIGYLLDSITMRRYWNIFIIFHKHIANIYS